MVQREIPKLNIDLNVDGAYNSEGQSRNVWGQVPVPSEILDFAFKAKLMGKKSCVWTAYDDAMYKSPNQRPNVSLDEIRQFIEDIVTGNKEISDRMLMFKVKKISDRLGIDAIMSDSEIVDRLKSYIELSKLGIPSTISATFKSCFRNYAAVVENLGMYIAIELDMPTSYNYIVEFDKEQYPSITTHYNSERKISELKPLGIVSIDMLQNKTVPEYEEEIKVKGESDYEWTKIRKNYSGDILAAFYETLNSSVKDNLEGDKNLIRNWIRGIHRAAASYMSDFTPEEKQKCLDNTDSRIVRSTLLREYVGDCDFTAYNGGIVVNKRKHSFRYAPNFDFGESFNGLVKGVLDVESTLLKPEVLNSLPPDVLEKLMSIGGVGGKKKTVEEVACGFASSTGKENFEYILLNYPHYAKEFFDNLQNALNQNAFDKYVDRYTKMYHDGKSLLTQEEAECFKKYLKIRGEWMITMAHNILKTNQVNEM